MRRRASSPAVAAVARGVAVVVIVGFEVLAAVAGVFAAGGCARVTSTAVADGATAGPDAGGAAGRDGAAPAGADAGDPADAARDLVSAFPDGRDPGGPCRNLQCRQVACPAGGTTSVTGTVYAPNGRLPLYNALVYVPNAPLPPMPRALTCDRCGTLAGGEPIVAALTDAHGVFTLRNVPAGADVPLVIQVGRWRRQVTLPSVPACTETRLTDPQLTRLPRNRAEGDLPRMAITTGACDNLVCLLPKLGLDPAELGVSGDDRAVTLFAGQRTDVPPETRDRFNPRFQRMAHASTLWGSAAELQKYDLVVLSCECDPVLETKPATAFDAMTRYLAAGGRVFGTDFQYVWYQRSPDPALRAAATIPERFVQGELGASPVALDTSFPKGKALADWFDFVRPGFPYGQIDCEYVFDNFTSAATPATQVWGSSPSPGGDIHPRFLTVNTPVGQPAEQQCGRAVHLDAHVAPLGAEGEFPDDCAADLEMGEQLLAFFLFDVASCIQEDSRPPVVPPIVID